MIRIVLCMIVKNESKIIERCLQSVLPVIDAISIVDTGSTDDTMKKVESFAGPNGHDLPLLLAKKEWKNFGHNRTESFVLARDCYKDFWSDSSGIYLLFLDADMILHMDPDKFDKQKLAEPNYSIVQHNGSLQYANVRLARLSHDWQAIGATHEFWRSTPDTISVPCEGLWIEDRGDGGSKGNKTERDIALLEEYKKFHPDDARTLFYLAQSYFDKGDWENAFLNYASRRFSLVQGWQEERWYALYKQGLSALKIGAACELEGLGILMQASAERPDRAEPLLALAEHFRWKGHHRMAWLCADAASKLSVPSTGLFVDKHAHTWRPLQEKSICGFYLDDKLQEGFEATQELMTMRGASIEHAALNASFYCAKTMVEPTERGTFNVRSFLVMQQNNDERFVPTNPCIFDKDNVVIRFVNYSQEHGKYYQSKSEDGKIRTRNFLSTSLDCTNLAEIQWKFADEVANENTQIFGLEDMRVIVHDDHPKNLKNIANWFTATCCQVPGHSGRPQVVVGYLHWKDSYIAEAIVHRTKYEKSQIYEKNWLPWSLNGKFYFIYSYDPFVVLVADDLNLAENEIILHEAHRSTPTFAATRWRGSAGPIKWGREQRRQYLAVWARDQPPRYLAVVHEKAFHNHATQYMHRFIEIEAELENVDDPTSMRFAIVRYSRPFVIDHAGVEYVTGMVAKDTGVLLTYGYEDREARWVYYENVEKFFE